MSTGLDKWAEILGYVEALQTLSKSDRLYYSLLEGGVDSRLLSVYMNGDRGRKSRTAAPVRSNVLVNKFLAMGGIVAGGAALCRKLHLPSSGDIDVFFNSYVDWVTATLLAYNDSAIDVCFYQEVPFELFDLDIACCAYDTCGFLESPICDKAASTGVSGVRLGNIIHPVATLRRMVKYGLNYKTRFNRDDVQHICQTYRVTNNQLIDEALSLC